MKKRTWVRLIVSLLVVGAIAIGLCIRWGPIGRGSDPLAAWGRGNPTLSERTYYISRINRLVREWDRTPGLAEHERDGRLKYYHWPLFVIDLDKQAVWIEENGRPRKNDYSELPPGMKWQLYLVTPQAGKELTGRIVLNRRDICLYRVVPERFYLIGANGAGYFHFQFPRTGGGGGYKSGPFRPPLFRLPLSTKSGDSYGSLLVTDGEYEQYVADANKLDAQASTWIEENRANWLRVEKSLYGQIERHLRSAGYELSRLEVEPGPDFSAGRAEIRGRNDSVVREFFGGSLGTAVYLKFNYLGDDIWYAKSARQHSQRPMISGRTLDLEFLVHATSEITDAQRSDLLAKGRRIQESVRTVQSKWKATLPSGATVEFIGICENPSAGKQWWGPDGSPIDHAPYINTGPDRRPSADRKLYEFVLGIGGGDVAIKHEFEGYVTRYYPSVRDKYGRIIEGLSAAGCGFEKSRRKAALRIRLATGDWQTALVVEDEAGETKVLDKHRIILNPPEIENGRIVVRCFEESSFHMPDYQTDFGLTTCERSVSKTVTMNVYQSHVRDHKDTGLTEHKFTLRHVSMSQIESVCFRYRPFEFVTFKNISLVPGENQGFEIVPGQ